MAEVFHVLLDERNKLFQGETESNGIWYNKGFAQFCLCSRTTGQMYEVVQVFLWVNVKGGGVFGLILVFSF